jgi:hypothetical protein
VDPIAYWTFVFTIIGAVAAVAAALFAAWGLYYAKRGPSKEDLQRVEDNTAQTARHVDAVREHTAASEAHLADQGKRELLLAQARRVSITAHGSGFNDMPLLLGFSVKDPDVKLRRIDMINKHGLPLGTLDCSEEAPLTFSVKMDPEVYSKWFSGSDVQGSIDQMVLRLCAYFEIGGDETNKTFSISMSQNLREKQPGTRNFSYFVEVYGGC